MACLLFLAVQAVRVFGLKSAADLQPSALERAASEGTRLTLAGTVDRIEEKEKVTAVFLKDNTVSVRGQHVNESKLLVYIEQNSTAEIKTGNIIQVSGEVSPFDPARNPGNFDQKAYYQRQGIHVLVWADDFTVLSSEADTGEGIFVCAPQQMEDAPDRASGRILREYNERCPSGRQERPG